MSEQKNGVPESAPMAGMVEGFQREELDDAKVELEKQKQSAEKPGDKTADAPPEKGPKPRRKAKTPDEKMAEKEAQLLLLRKALTEARGDCDAGTDQAVLASASSEHAPKSHKRSIADSEIESKRGRYEVESGPPGPWGELMVKMMDFLSAHSQQKETATAFVGEAKSKDAMKELGFANWDVSSWPSQEAICFFFSKKM